MSEVANGDVGGVVDDEAVARFTARYAGGLDPSDALRWAVDPLAPATDGSASPGAALEERRRALYRAPADAAAAARFAADVESWRRELALARAALPAPPVAAAPAGAPPARPRVPSRGTAVAATLAVLAAVAGGIAVLARPAPPPAPPIAAGVPGVLVAQASAGRGPRSGAGLDGAGHFVTVVVTCQGAGSVDVRLTDGTDARFACVATFPRTAVQPSGKRVRRFGYRVTVTGEPNWAMTLSR